MDIFDALAMSTVSSTAFVNVPKDSVASKGLLKIFMLPLTLEAILLRIFNKGKLTCLVWNVH